MPSHFKLNARRSDTGQLELAHVTHTPAHHLTHTNNVCLLDSYYDIMFIHNVSKDSLMVLLGLHMSDPFGMTVVKTFLV